MPPLKLCRGLKATSRLPRSRDPIALAEPIGDLRPFRLSAKGQAGETVAFVRSKIAMVR